MLQEGRKADPLPGKQSKQMPPPEAAGGSVSVAGVRVGTGQREAPASRGRGCGWAFFLSLAPHPTKRRGDLN